MGRSLLVLCVGLAACSVDDYDYHQVEIELEVISPPINSGGIPVYVANGPLILGSYLSEDGGATWATLNPAIQPSVSQAPNDHELIVQTTQFGLGRWMMDTDQVTAIPSLGAPDKWHVRPATDTFLMHLAGSTDYGRQIGIAGAMTRVPIPPPAGPLPASEPYTESISSNDDVAVMSSAWGQYRSLDDGQSWELVTAPTPGNDVWVPLPDGRFLLFSDNRDAEIYDDTGTPTGVRTATFPQATSARVACLDGIVQDQQFTRDLGETWEPLVPTLAGETLNVGAFACGGDYLVLYVDAPVQLTTKTTTLGELGDALQSPVQEPVAVSAAFRSTGGTWFGANFAWREGDAAWTLRILPEATFFALADGSLLGLSAQTVYRSRDEGVTFETTPSPTAPVEPTRVLSSDDGSLWAAASSSLLRSRDDGATWEDVYATATTRPELVAIEDGTFVGRDDLTGLFVSYDQAATWEALPFPSPFHLAFVTHSGDAATWDGCTDDDGRFGGCWHLWRDYGLGAAYREVIPTMADATGAQMSIELGESGLYPALDATDRFYVFGGAGRQGVFRSTGALSD